MEFSKMENLEIKFLGYIGGQNEELGGYCEPIVIRINGTENYILHEMHTFYKSELEIKTKHSKVEFGSLEELTLAFERVQKRLMIDSSLPWVETDPYCGYDISKEVWENAFRKRPRNF